MEMNEEKLAALLNDKDFDVIELGLKGQNIFNILGAARTEIRHSNFLAWLLQPDAGHGLGSTILSRFLRDIFSDDKCHGKTLFDADLLNYDEIQVLREWKNIDLLVLLEDDVIVVENKVDSVDHSNQLKRYKKIAEEEFPDKNRHFVYLTPFGNEPQDQDAAEYYVCYSYSQFIKVVENVLNVFGDNIPAKIETYISDYISIVRREIMKEEKLNELALKMYKAHKEALDFIFDNKPDPATEMYPYFEAAVIKRGWVVGSKGKGAVKFVTSKMAEILPEKMGNWWPKGEVFLFELNYYWEEDKAVFKSVISPGDEKVRAVLNDIFINVEEHKKPVGKKWLVHFTKKQTFRIQDLINEDKETIEEKVDSIVAALEPHIERFEKIIVANKEKIDATVKAT